MPTAAITTLGCRLNQADSGMMAELLRRLGFRLVRWGEPADLLVVNSCTVTAGAARKTRQTVRAARRRRPNAFIVLAGCDVDIHGDEWAAEPAVDLLLPNSAKARLPEFLPQPLVRPDHPIRVPPALSAADPFAAPVFARFPHRTRANLKVQEGCDFFCSYCIVPHARGRPRSRAWDDCLREARALIGRGHRELVVCGVNLMLYSDAGRRLPDLIAALAELPGEFRLRISSVEPGPGLQRLFEVMAAYPRRVCRFLHLSLQYGEDSILAAMNRRYRVREFAEFAAAAVERIPGLCLGTDVIVGFPGEDDSKFEICRRTLDSLPLAYFHVFPYSPRQGTPAAEFAGRPDGAVAARRSAVLRALSIRKSAEFARRHVGARVAVLTEVRTRHGDTAGWSDNYLKVTIPDPARAVPLNRFLPVRVESVMEGRRVRGTVLPGDAGGECRRG